MPRGARRKRLAGRRLEEASAVLARASPKSPHEPQGRQFLSLRLRFGRELSPLLAAKHRITLRRKARSSMTAPGCAPKKSRAASPAARQRLFINKKFQSTSFKSASSKNVVNSQSVTPLAIAAAISSQRAFIRSASPSFDKKPTSTRTAGISV